MRIILAASLLLTFCGVAQAEVHCLEIDTIETCSQRLLGQVEQEVQQDLKNEVAAKNTGDAAASTVNDFLPLLRALINAGGDANGGGKMGIEWSNPLGLPAQEQNKIIVALEKSAVYEPLKVALRAASLEDQIGALEDGIHEGDDVTFGFSYARASKEYGRDPRMHATMISALMKAATPTVVDNTVLTDFERKLLTTGRTLNFDGDIPFNKIGLTPEELKQYVQLVETSLRTHHQSMRAFGEQLQRLGLYGLLDLINNQPQWSFTASYRARGEVVGPDEFKAALSYEKGWANVNAYREYQQDHCPSSGETDCLAQYLAQESVQANLKQSLRVIAKVEYSRLQRFDFALPNTTFAYAAAPVTRFGFNAGLGLYLGREVAGITRTRVDAIFSYEDFSDDPTRQDRGLATVTFTYPVSGGFLLSLGAVYATKPEFRGDVNEEISARAGILYKVMPDK